MFDCQTPRTLCSLAFCDLNERYGFALALIVCLVYDLCACHQSSLFRIILTSEPNSKGSSRRLHSQWLRLVIMCSKPSLSKVAKIQDALCNRAFEQASIDVIAE